MRKNIGWVKVHRKIMDKGYYKKSEYVHLWLHLILLANHKPNEFMWNGNIIKIERGQVLTGRKQLSEKTGIGESKVERILKLFENEQQIEQQKTTKFRIITLKNHELYQNETTSEQQIEQQLNNKRTTTEQQLNTNKNDKKEENDKNDKKRDLPEKTPAKNLINEMRLLFEDYYLTKKNIPYHYNGKDAGNLKQLKNKINHTLKPELKTDEGILNGFKFILLNLNDEWVLQNLDIANLNSKFNQILDKIKNGKTGSSNSREFDPSVNKGIFS